MKVKKNKIISVCETVGGAMVLAMILTLFWVIWDLSRLPLQVLGTEFVIAVLCWVVQGSQEHES